MNIMIISSKTNSAINIIEPFKGQNFIKEYIRIVFRLGTHILNLPASLNMYEILSNLRIPYMYKSLIGIL